MRKDQVDKQAEAEALVRGAVNQPVSLSFLRGKQLKIVVELACEPDGLGLDGLAERCLVHDLDNLRRECQRLERNWGLLNSLAGAHGRQTWCLVGRLDLIQGRLFWTAQPESLPDKTRRMRAQSAGKRGKPAAGSPATRNTGSRYISPQTQLPENSVTGCAEAGNTGSCPAAGGLEKPAAGGLSDRPLQTRCRWQIPDYRPGPGQQRSAHRQRYPPLGFWPGRLFVHRRDR